jgi:hypothetical protein
LEGAASAVAMVAAEAVVAKAVMVEAMDIARVAGRKIISMQTTSGT